MKKILAFLIFGLISFGNLFYPGTAYAGNSSIIDRVKGRILLQVESQGEAWYVHPETGLRYYMKDGASAYEIMRSLGLGITNNDLATIPFVDSAQGILKIKSECQPGTIANRVKGKILLQVESAGEAFYVHPDTCTRVYLKDGTAAYIMMRYVSLGVKTKDLEQIKTGKINPPSTTTAYKSQISIPATVVIEALKAPITDNTEEKVSYISAKEWKDGYSDDREEWKTILTFQRSVLYQTLIDKHAADTLKEFLTKDQVSAIESGKKQQILTEIIGPNSILAGLWDLEHPDLPSALCKDGTVSYSKHRSGTCSWHDGVLYWY